MIKFPSNLIAPTILYYVLFALAIGGTLLVLLSIFMMIRGVVQKKSKKYFFAWAIVLVIAAALGFLSLTGQLITVI